MALWKAPIFLKTGKVTNPELTDSSFESPLYTGNLVSKTGLASSIVFQLEATDGNQAKKDRFIEGAQKITDDLQRQYPDLKFYLSRAVTQKIVHVLKSKTKNDFVPITVY